MHQSLTTRVRLQVLVLITALAVSVGGLPISASAAPSTAAATGTVSARAAEQAANDSDGDGTLDRPDAVSAAVTARVTDEPVEDLSSRTGSSTTVVNPDGTKTMQDFGSPVRVQGEDGSWADVNFDLVKQADGTYAPKVSATETVVGGGGSTTAAGVSFDDGSNLGVRWPQVLPEPTVAGGVATYEIDDAVDLVVAVVDGGVSTTIRLNEKPSAADRDLVLGLESDGLKVAETAQGGLQVSNEDGDKVGRAGTMTAWDSRTDAAGDPLETVALDAGLATTEGSGFEKTQELTLSAPDSFLDDPATVYPVTIDPDISSVTRVRDTYVQNGDTTSNGTSHGLVVGAATGNTANPAVSFAQFDTTALTGKTVVSAELDLYQYYSYTCLDRQMLAQPVAAPWVDSIVWTNRPAGRYGTGDDASLYANKGTSGCAGGWSKINVTNMVDAWADGTYPNYGFRLAVPAASETYPSFERRFCSMNPNSALTYCNTASVKPYLKVTYNGPPNTAALPTTTASSNYNGDLWVTKAKPTWTTSATDPEASKVAYTVQTLTSPSASTATATCTTAQVASGAAASCTPTAGLAANTTYVVRSKAVDSYGVSGGWSRFRTIKTEFTTPVVPTLSCTDVADGQWYVTRPATSSTCSVSGNGADIDYELNSVTQDALTTTATTSVPIPLSGLTSIKMRSRNVAGVVSEWASVEFGTGPAALSLPIRDDRSSSTFPIEGSAPAGASSAKIQWRFAPDTAGGTPDPEAGWADATAVKKASDDTPWSGTVTGTTTSATPKLVWDPQSESGISTTALVEVRVVFTFSGSVKVSPLQRVQVVPHAFGGSFPTDAAGPGEVALFTGEFQMSQSDVSVPGYGGALSLGRSHLSLAGTPAGPAGVFGPGWKADLSGPDEGVGGFTVIDRTEVDGSLTLASPEGDSFVYRHSTGTRGAQQAGSYLGVGETALEEDTLTMTTVTGESGVSNRLTLTEWDGTKTIFVRTNSVWTTEKVIGTEDNSTTSYAHDGEGSVTWIFAPAPAGVACDVTTQQPGCRALHLNYTGTGTAKRLASVDLRIYDPHTGTDGLPGSGAGMDTISVAKYAYDSAGQLVASWDPRVADGASALKTEYTYDPIDTAGHTKLKTLTEPGLKAWTFNYDSTGRLATLTRTQDAAVGGAAATWTLRYDLALSGAGLPDLTAATTATWAQPAADAPAAGAAVFGPDRVPTGPPSSDDYEYASLSYWTKSGRMTNSGAYGAGAWQIDSQRYDDNGNIIWALGAQGRNKALAEGTTVAEKAGAAEKYATVSLYNSAGTRVEETYSPTHDFVLKDGTPFTGRTLTETVYDGEPDAAGFMDGRPTTGVPVGGFDLPVREFVSATDKSGPGSVGVLYDTDETRYRYDPIQSGDGDGWDLKTPTKVSTQDGSGWSVTSTRFDSEGKVTETRTPQSNDSTGTAATARTMQTVYYTANGAAARAECRSTPQWTGQVCWHGTAGQPSSGAAIPDSTTTGYTTLLAPSRVVESSGAAVRTSIASYDAAGRPTSSAIQTSGLATADRAVAPVTTTYSTTTGAPTTITNGTQTQTTGYDTWGRVTSQSDGTGNTATTSYDTAGRVAAANDGKGTYTYTYNGTDSLGSKERRGLVTKLDVGLATGPDEFTGAYDDAGQLSEQNYPGGTKATWTRDLTGAATSLAYTQGSTDLIAFTNTLDQFGRVRANNGPSSDQSYRYDDRDRLTKVEDTANSACTTRVYDFSKDSNRKTLTTYAPDTTAGNEGACRSTGTAASTKTPSFDDADRITTPGYTYDALGRTKSMPAVDTSTALESPNDLTVGYHANDMVATLSQSGTEGGVAVTKSQDFTLDASNRVSVIKNLSDAVSLEESTNHYDGGGDSPAWTETKKRPDTTTAWATTWTRNISSLGGDLAIIQGSEVAPELQLTNLHGDVVSTLGVATTGIDSYTETDEYGVPKLPQSAGNRYGWLGAKQRQSDGIDGGLTLMGARLYNPMTGRFLSRDSIEGANDNSYGYPADPVNKFDLDGRGPCSRRSCDVYGSTGSQPAQNGYRWIRYKAHKIGNLAEAAAYRDLRRSGIPMNRIIWSQHGISGNRVSIRVDNKVMKRNYDMSYFDDQGRRHYLEIKANNQQRTPNQRKFDAAFQRDGFLVHQRNYTVPTGYWKRVCIAYCPGGAY